MSLDNPNGIESSVSKNTKIRRTFLKRASAGVIVASIPAKSVWANGITNSIIASGHGSDFANGREIELLSPCSILTLLRQTPDAGLDLNFYDVFGEGPNKTFSEILSCHCECPDKTTKLRRAISNVVFYTESGQQFKIEYPRNSEITDPSHPSGYYTYIQSLNNGKVVDYVIKAGNKYFSPTGAHADISYPSWFAGHKGVTKVNGNSFSSAAVACEGDETTNAMIAIYLNARFDLYFRAGIAIENWSGSHGIYYPILNSTDNVEQLVTSINTSKNQLIDILSQYGATDPLLSCP